MKIKGTGSYVPYTVIKNEAISHDPDWVFSKLGIRERRQNHFKTTSAMAIKAAKKAIEDAGIEPNEIGLIICATSTPDKLAPSMACIVQNNIRAWGAAAFDLNAVCSGFVYALSVASEMPYENILVIGADTFSQITDYDDRNSVFFGDGAGAVIVSGRANYKIYADGIGEMDFQCDRNGTFEMDGKAVFKAGLEYLPIAINDVLRDAGLYITDIDWLLPHQASIRMIEQLADNIGLPFRKVLTNMERYGNTAAASIAILLDEGEFKTGDKLLLASIGSGWTYGAMIIKW